MKQACKLCRKSDRPLRRSHTIPKAVFKRMHSSDGKFVEYNIDKHEFNEKAQDQGAEVMLCDRCEGYLNTNYEDYSLKTLRDNYSAPDGNRMYWTDVNLHTINMYCLSVLWRCMVSGHPLFKEIPNVPTAVEYYRDYILTNTAISRPKFAVKISRLDVRGIGLPSDWIVGPTLNPTIAMLPNDGVVVRFVYWGYLFEKYPCCFKRSVPDRTGIVMKNKTSMYIPDTDIREHEFIMVLLASAEQKLVGSIA